MRLAERDKLCQVRKIVLSIGVDLQRMSKASRASQIESLHHRSAFAAIGVEPINCHFILWRMKCGQCGTRGLIAPIVYYENW